MDKPYTLKTASPTHAKDILTTATKPPKHKTRKTYSRQETLWESTKAAEITTSTLFTAREFVCVFKGFARLLLPRLQTQKASKLLNRNTFLLQARDA